MEPLITKEHPQNDAKNPNKPRILKALFWLKFSSTATISAFILPIHIWALATGNVMKLSWMFAKIYFLILFGAALFHGLYRTETILFDLGVTKGLKIIGFILSLIFLTSFVLFGVRLFA